MTTFEKLNFDNQALKQLPVDSSPDYLIQRPVPNACFHRVKPTPVDEPKLVAISEDAFKLIGLDPSEFLRSDAAEYLSGNSNFPGADYAAHCYCGHQFGNFAGQLGDGATMYIGEVLKENGSRWEIQFKGAGKTPFSRTADGRKVLRSSIREFLCSEAMHNLGVPTTRAGSIVVSFDTTVIRDKFYDGNAQAEPTSIITRLAPTFIRFGSFEIIRRGGPSAGRLELATQLADYTIKTCYPQIEDTEEKYKQLIKAVSEKTAELIAKWQLIGWCHGVMNTDNMSIAGVTLDYGPFGFMDRFDPEFICNASDNRGRYTYSNQPLIGKWNLMKWAETMEHLVPRLEARECIQESYDETYMAALISGARSKMGLFEELDGDKELYESLLTAMLESGADFTNTFRALAGVELSADGEVNDSTVEKTKEFILNNCCYSAEDCQASPDAGSEQELSMLRMMLRHGMLDPEQQAQLQGNLAEYEAKMNKFKMTNEEKKVKDKEYWDAWFTVYKVRLSREKSNEGRKRLMNSANPKFILRNHILEKSIQMAEDGDFSEVNRLLELFKDPYDIEDQKDSTPEYQSPPKSEDICLKVT